MEKYSSKPTTINMSFDEMTERLSDFTFLQHKLDELPAEDRARIGDVHFGMDSIEITTPQVGKICLDVTERIPGRLSLSASSSPVPMSLSLNYEADGDNAVKASSQIEVELPFMLKALVGPAIQKAVDQMGGMFASLL